MLIHLLQKPWLELEQIERITGILDRLSPHWAVEHESAAAVLNARREKVRAAASEAETERVKYLEQHGQGRSEALKQLSQFGIVGLPSLEAPGTGDIERQIADISQENAVLRQEAAQRGVVAIGSPEDAYVASARVPLKGGLEELACRLCELLSADGAVEDGYRYGEIREYGEALHRVFGKRGMILVFRRVEALGGRHQVLNGSWNGIGSGDDRWLM